MPNTLNIFRHKEIATYKIDALQKNLSESIPSSTLDEANRQYTELTMKYRDLLQNENTRNAQVFNGIHLNIVFTMETNNAKQLLIRTVLSPFTIFLILGKTPGRI